MLEPSRVSTADSRRASVWLDLIYSVRSNGLPNCFGSRVIWSSTGTSDCHTKYDQHILVLSNKNKYLGNILKTFLSKWQIKTECAKIIIYGSTLSGYVIAMLFIYAIFVLQILRPLPWNFPKGPASWKTLREYKMIRLSVSLVSKIYQETSVISTKIHALYFRSPPNLFLSWDYQL